MMLDDPKPCHTCGRDARYCSCDRTITAMLHEYRGLRDVLNAAPPPAPEEARPMNRAQRRAARRRK